MILKKMSTQANLKTRELTANYYENYVNTYTCGKSALAYIHCYVPHNRQLPLYKFLFETRLWGQNDKSLNKLCVKTDTTFRDWKISIIG